MVKLNTYLCLAVVPFIFLISEMFRNTLILMLPVLTFLILSSTFNANAGNTIVVPNTNAVVEGNSVNGLPFNCGIGLASNRTQHLYASSQFSQSCFITQISFILRILF